MEDRRAPLGGISKQTFVNPESDTHERELLYDMLSCIDSKIQVNSKKIEQINKKCPADCIVEFDKRYLRRIHAIIGGLMLMALLVGYGALKWGDIIELVK